MADFLDCYGSGSNWTCFGCNPAQGGPFASDTNISGQNVSNAACDDWHASMSPSGQPGVAPYKPELYNVPNRKPKTLRRTRGRSRFSGMNPVQQRQIAVNPSQGGFFSVPQDERNFGQQSALPYGQQLNFSHTNASGCGYSNMNHGKSNMNHMNMNHKSNFGANTASTTWSGSQTNVGPQDRIYAGNYASGQRSNVQNNCIVARQEGAGMDCSKYAPAGEWKPCFGDPWSCCRGPARAYNLGAQKGR